MLALPPLPATGTRALWRCDSTPGSAWLLAQLANQHRGLVLAIATGEQQAYKLEAELRFFGGPSLAVAHMPDPEILPYDAFSPHQEILSDRMAVLSRLPHLQSGVLIVTADALLQRLPPREWLQGRSFSIRTGDTLETTEFTARLIAAGYQSVSEVQTQGEYAVRGALIDLFPMGSSAAYRLDLFDNEVESIREFDPETQRSTQKVESIELLPAREVPTDAAAREQFRANYRAYFPGDPSRSRIYEQVSRGNLPAGIEAYLPLFFEHTEYLLDYLPANTLLTTLGDLDAALALDWQQINERFESYRGDLERPLMQPADLFRDPQQVAPALLAHAQIQLSAAADASDLALLPLTETDEALKQRLQNFSGRSLIVAESPGRREAVRDWLQPLGLKARDYKDWADFCSDSRRLGMVVGPIQDGLQLGEQIQIIAEPQIFGLRAQVSRRRKPVRDPDTILRDLDALSIGSPVVHVEHGVGRYAGLKILDAGGFTEEYLVIEYAGQDKLYVPVASLRQVHRYTGAESETAPLHAMGSERWRKARAKAREKARDVAAELLQIQARRAARVGQAMPLNELDYRRFCEGFAFETTPDQQQAIDQVLADLAGTQPMDRVVCGDVGFGKTEVALRASFAAAQNGFQVCLLAPTTLLAQQHYKNFCDRFADWPIKIGVASRLRTGKELNALVRELESGNVDIVIGTHRLLQDDVRFKQLGLVIVDEEHRFGVRHKERMKKLRAEVDLLTLTATPIPRTLNMSMAGLRDLSIIATPPPLRLAIRTFVSDWDRALVQEACLRELRRGGQIYYLHNEVKDIEQTAESISRIVPQARVRFAHGQMRERELEQVMLDFYHQRFDILVSTTIIESGIDVPSANTMIIDRADKLGLAQLHQLRGRVGRSHHRAYAYLMVPSKQALSGDAEKRLEAIEAMGELGSGFTLATHDLEIRGAGELLGEGQSGQMEEIGFTLYSDLLSRAVQAIRSGRVDDEPLEPVEHEVDLGISALIPDDYVPDIHTRLTLYKRIADAADQAALAELKVEMIDRFGMLPPAAGALFQAAELRIRTQALGIRKASVGDDRIKLEFTEQPALDPMRLIALVQRHPNRYRLEGAAKLHYACPIEHDQDRARSLGELLDTLSLPADQP